MRHDTLVHPGRPDIWPGAVRTQPGDRRFHDLLAADGPQPPSAGPGVRPGPSQSGSPEGGPGRLIRLARFPGPSRSRYRPSRSPRYTVSSSSAPVMSRNSRPVSAAGSPGSPRAARCSSAPMPPKLPPPGDERPHSRPAGLAAVLCGASREDAAAGKPALDTPRRLIPLSRSQHLTSYITLPGRSRWPELTWQSDTAGRFRPSGATALIAAFDMTRCLNPPVAKRRRRTL